MSLIDLYSGYRPFSTDDEIISTVKRSKSFDVKQEDISKSLSKNKLYNFFEAIALGKS